MTAKKTTAREPGYDVPDLTGKRALVTGASSGLGLETASRLAASGAQVLMAVRDELRGEQALKNIRAENPEADVSLGVVDLGDLVSIRNFAEGLIGEGQRLDLLVNNAGVKVLPKRSETVDGFEEQLGVNFLGHFALTGMLLPHLRDVPTSRVVSLGSKAAMLGPMRWKDLQMTQSYQGMRAYAQSKRACMIYAVELQRRLSAQGSRILSVTAHPGYSVPANNAPASTQRIATWMWNLNTTLGTRQTHGHGALPILYAATASDVLPAGYIGPQNMAGLSGEPGPENYPRSVLSPESGRRLWVLAEELTGKEYLSTALTG